MDTTILRNLAEGRKINKSKLIHIVFVCICAMIARNIFIAGQKDLKKLTLEQEKGKVANTILTEIVVSEKQYTAYKGLLNVKDPGVILNSISTLAKNSLVKILSMKPQMQKEYPLYTYYSFEMTISTDSFHKIGQLVKSLENSNEVFLIDSLSVTAQTSGDAGSSSKKIEAEFLISTLLIKEYRK
ncbi:MAG: type 4a pilus biogenesis protein PilO [Candidatus Omnitrophota bacterium]|jgi:hypothetical protein